VYSIKLKPVDFRPAEVVARKAERLKDGRTECSKVRERFPSPSNDTQSLTRFSCSLEAMAAAAVQEAIKQGKGEAERFVNDFLYV
jgi:hypothetical protein